MEAFSSSPLARIHHRHVLALYVAQVAGAHVEPRGQRGRRELPRRRGGAHARPRGGGAGGGGGARQGRRVASRGWADGGGAGRGGKGKGWNVGMEHVAMPGPKRLRLCLVRECSVRVYQVSQTHSSTMSTQYESRWWLCLSGCRVHAGSLLAHAVVRS